MADLTITASEVQTGTGAVLRSYVCAAAITAGEPVALDTDGKAVLADASAEATAAAKGIAVNSAAIGQQVQVQESGDLTLGATAAPASGTVYGVSATAGGIAPVADLLSTEYTTVLGVGIGSNQIRLGRIVGGVKP